MIARTIRTLIPFTLLLSVCIVSGFAEKVVLVQRGVPQFGLAIAGNPAPAELTAVDELTHFVERMSGAVLPRVTPETDGPKIYLGCADAFPQLKRLAGLLRRAQELEPEAYLTEAVEGDLYLLGGSPQGVLWAVYGLLHEFGCRWYMPGPIGEVVPTRKTLLLDGSRRVEAPDFQFRQIWYTWGGPKDGGPRFQEWKRRNRLAHPYVQHGHNLKPSLPSSASFEERPELYSLVDGKRRPQQVCTSNPEVVELIAQTVNAFFDKYPEALCYSLCPDDNDDFCECETCEALDTGGFDVDRQKPVVTDRYVTFLNQVAEGIQERHPGKMVSMYAYINHSTPPVRTPVSPYVVIFFTTSVYCGGHGIGDAHCASRMRMKADLAEWARVCPNVYIYEYDPVPGNVELPWPLYGARTREMPVYRAMGIQGISMESHCSWATLSPNHWVSARGLWDADLSVETLLQDYCRGFFGLPGDDGRHVVEAMSTFYRTLEQALARHKPKIEWGHRDIPDIYTSRTIGTCRTALNKALEKAANSSHPNAVAVLERLRMVDVGFRFLERYLDGVGSDRKGGDFQTIQAAYDDCKKLIDEMVATNTDFIEVESSRPGLKEALGEIVNTSYGKESGLISTWNAIGPFDNAEFKGHATAYPPERTIDLGATYDGVNGPVGWNTISAGEGRGFVNLLHHFTPTDWVTIYALTYLHTERAMDAELRVGSNDSVKVWLDGKSVWDFGGERGAVFDDDVIPVRLEPGWTPVLLKVSQSGNKWGFFFRVTDREGHPVPSVTSALKPTKQ